MYTGLIFSGIVKSNYRSEVSALVNTGSWSNTCSALFRNFSNYSRCDFIPFGSLSYMPDSWDDLTHLTYDEQSGEWSFVCSLKNYDGEIDRFLEMTPTFMESVSHAEVLYETWAYSKEYKLVNGNMIMVNDKYIKYYEESDEGTI
jgi:hypothetical protein